MTGQTQTVASEALLSCVLLAQKKEPGAFEQLYDLAHERVFRFCVYLSGNREVAEELTQDTFVRAYKALAELREPQRILSWLLIIARRRFLDLRKQSTREQVLQSEDLERLVDEELSDSKSEEILAVQAAMKEMSPDDRALLLMVHLEGHSYEDVGQVLGISEDQVRSKLRTARRRFMKKFDSV